MKAYIKHVLLSRVRIHRISPLYSLIRMKMPYRKHVLLSRVKNSWHKPIVFTHEDEDALVIFIILFNYNVYKILIDDGYVVNILLEDAMIQIDVDLTKLTYIKTSL